MIWKPVKGFEKYYLVSDTGLVKSVPRVAIRSNGRAYSVKEKVLSAAKDGGGYLRVALSVDGRITTKKVHRLVAEAFCSGDDRLEVNHINGDKSDNRSCNLEFCTRSENVKHAFKTGLAKPLTGVKNPCCKIDEIKALTIKTLIVNKNSLADISRKLNVSYHIVKDISRGKTWKHIVV